MQIFQKLASFVIGLNVSYSNITLKGSHWGEKSYFSDSECFHKLKIFGLVIVTRYKQIGEWRINIGKCNLT